MNDVAVGIVRTGTVVQRSGSNSDHTFIGAVCLRIMLDRCHGLTRGQYRCRLSCRRLLLHWVGGRGLGNRWLLLAGDDRVVGWRIGGSLVRAGLARVLSYESGGC